MEEIVPMARAKVSAAPPEQFFADVNPKEQVVVIFPYDHHIRTLIKIMSEMRNTRSDCAEKGRSISILKTSCTN